MTSVEEKEVTSEQQEVEEPPPTDEQTITNEANESESGKEKGDEEQKSEDNGQATGQVDTKEEVEPEPTAKPSVQPVDNPPRKLRCIDPSGTVDIRVGKTGIGASKPITVPTFFENAFKTYPDVKALCWKDKKEDPWRSLTYAQYKRLIYNVAKSFLKVNLVFYVLYYLIIV